MKTNIRFLVKRLTSFNPEHIQINDGNANIRTIKFFTKAQTAFEPDILYISQDAYAFNKIPGKSTLNLVCIGFNPIENNLSGNAGLNLIVLKQGADIFNVFNAVEDALLKEQVLDFWSEKFINILSENRSLQYLIDTGYEMLENPFYIFDNYGKCIGRTDNVSIANDPVWNEFSATGYISYNTFMSSIENGLVVLVDNAVEPFIWHSPCGKLGKIFSKIEIENKKTGTLAIIEYNRQFNEDDLRLASLFCDAFSAYLQKNEVINYSNDKICQTAFEDILSRKNTGREIVDEIMKMLKLQSKAALCAVSIDLGTSYGYTEISLAHLGSILEKEIGNSKAIAYDNRIFLLLTSKNNNYLFEKELQLLEEFLAGREIHAGISSFFNEFELIYEHYLQSLKALELGKKIDAGISIYLYDNYSICHFIEEFLTDVDYMEFCHPALLALIEYDRNNNSSLAQTLYIYLIYSRNVTDTANTLNIHRNTVIYQLKKICEITNIDLKNSNVILQLHISYKMLELEKSKKSGGSHEN